MNNEDTNQSSLTPTGRLTKAAELHYASLGEKAFAAGMDRFDWADHEAFAASALAGMSGKARRKALESFIRGWVQASDASLKTADKVQAEITAVSSSRAYATVVLANGRVEHIVRRGMMPDFVLGATCFVAYSRTTSGYAWAFVSY